MSEFTHSVFLKTCIFVLGGGGGAGSQTVEADFQHSEENYMYLKHHPGEKGDESIFFPCKTLRRMKM